MEEALIKRIMPNSLEAEQSVVGSMIMSKDAIVTASEMLLKEDFYHQQYGRSQACSFSEVLRSMPQHS